MSNMTVKVEFLAGTSVGEAILEAKAKAKLWDVSYIIFEFNGTRFSIGRNADAEKVMLDWDSRKTTIIHS